MAGYYDTGRKLKAFIIIVSILLIINGFISYLSYKNRASFYANEGKFSSVSQSEDELVFKDMDKNILRVEIEDKTPNEISFATRYKVYYKDRIIESDSSKYKTEGLIITQSDSSKYTEKFTDNNYAKIYRLNVPEESLSSDVLIIYNIERVHDNLEENNSLRMFFWFAAVTIIGTILIVFPKSFLNSEIAIAIMVLTGLILILGAFFYNIIYAFIF